MKKTQLLIAPLSALLLTACSSGPDDDGQYRQGVFQSIAWHFSALGAMANDRAPFDSEDFARRAAIIEQLSVLPWEGFTEGSAAGSGAKAEIWANREDFDGKAEDFINAAQALAQADNEADMRSRFSATADTCRSCHNDYRER